MALAFRHGHHALPERRRGADSLIILIRSFSILGWLVLVAAMAVYDHARPERSFIDERILRGLGLPLHLRRSWDFDLAQYIFYLMVMGLVLGLVGLAATWRRHRRHDDSYRLYLILITLISSTGVWLYLLKIAA